jgi:hypothetical protein
MLGSLSLFTLSEMVFPCFPLNRTASIYGSTALVDLGRFFSFLIYTQSVGLLGLGISPSQGRYLHTEQHKHRINTHTHPCLEWNSNPWSQSSSGWRRFIPQTVRPLWLARLHLPLKYKQIKWESVFTWRTSKINNSITENSNSLDKLTERWLSTPPLSCLYSAVDAMCPYVRPFVVCTCRKGNCCLHILVRHLVSRLFYVNKYVSFLEYLLVTMSLSGQFLS